MPAYKDTGNTWRAVYRYTDWKVTRRQTQKRGFATKHEALAWEREQLLQAAADLDMTFGSFVDSYTADMKNRLKENTWHTKEHIIRTKILPYFEKRKISEIKPKDIIAWQNELLGGKDKNGKPYSPVYLKTVHNQLSAIFNHAKKFYGLHDNPAAKVGNMGKEKTREMLFWTQEEYTKFADSIMDKPLSYYAFELLYWCGLREGELLALTPADFDFEKQTVSITKSYQRIYWLMILSKPYIQSTINMALKGILSKGQLSEMVFPFPPLSLQQQFAAFVEQTDKSKLAVKKVLEKAETLKKALMQEYFG